jgi:hypothetical protein
MDAGVVADGQSKIVAAATAYIPARGAALVYPVAALRRD